MKLSPRQLVAWLKFAQISENQDRAEMLSLYTLAARGSPEDIKKRLKELSKDD